MMWVEETPKLKGKKSRKGKKRSQDYKHGQAVHRTKNGRGVVAQLRKK